MYVLPHPEKKKFYQQKNESKANVKEWNLLVHAVGDPRS